MSDDDKKLNEETSSEQERQSGQTGETVEVPPLDVYGMIKWVLGLMASSAWQYMGLMPNPASGKIEKDMLQAKVAIDVAVFLGDKIANHLPEDERKNIRNLINDLQVNFVRHSD